MYIYFLSAEREAGRMNNTTECSFENCYTEQQFIFIPEVQITFLILYGLVSIIGTFGNLFIVITVIRWGQGTLMQEKCDSEVMYLFCFQDP